VAPMARALPAIPYIRLCAPLFYIEDEDSRSPLNVGNHQTDYAV
jgi:hypothetical protein